MKKIIGICFVCILFLGGCGQKEPVSKVETGNLQGVSQNQTIEIETKDATIALRQKDGLWYKETNCLPFMVTFFDSLETVTGEKVEPPKEAETLFTLKSDGKKIQFVKENEHYYFLEKNQAFLVEQPPNVLSKYDPLFFTEVTYEVADVENLSRVHFQSDENEFTLSRETSLSKIEQAPFVSGWYMNDYYHQSYSVRYDQLQSITQILGQLLIETTSETPETTSLVTTLQLTDKEKQTQRIQLYQKEAVYFLNMGDEFYRLSAYQANQLYQAPMEWIDPFSALIPADALTKLTIDVGENQYVITGQHALAEDQKSLTSEFKVNQKLIDEALFRKAYQYCGVLSGSEEYAQQEIAKTPFGQLSYTFLSEGQELTRELSYFPLVEDEALVAVSENDQIDFVMEKERLLEMERALQELSK
ncbi:hypothetical protein [Enterococcus phoeniculicola]|jgi:hypothetical protein|uniref:DUF4340 domain-containing protein n=1 Tax=Enterococcus phoeniculicola ATCC BAA-412 TaxID=1158610 RepID=R3TJV9_9ENTE|nr:hypothetical protein [Enterococcus phoeniculicola]EOL41714.1 hypothetical protein UC3_03279 [Enterococcus phoeniculicola ATCC BAA-412]EOT78792.1 hypothetical protein I589_00297 [Enterococcus phoeniculicola ATCC BAA-412]